MTNKFLSIIVVFLAFLAFLPISAQVGFDLDANNFFIELRPTNAPVPNQNITAKLSTTSFDLNGARIIWTHNGRVSARGTGVREYGFTAGPLGSRESLAVSAIDANGLRHDTELSFVVSDVTMLWQTDTSIPYWYKGKALASPKSAITVSAFPELISGGRKIPSSGLIFRWSLDDDFKQAQSGTGKDIFRFGAGFSSGLAHSVSLEVSNIDGSVSAKKSININIENPGVLIYEYDPLLGTKNNSAFGGQRSGIIFAGEEKSFIAHPFFFSPVNGGKNLEYGWGVNGQAAEPGEPSNILRLKTASDAGGRSTIEVLIKNLSNILQRANQSFSIDVL